MKRTFAWGIGGIVAASATAVLITGGTAQAHPGHFTTAGSAQQLVQSPPTVEIGVEDGLPPEFDEFWVWSDSPVVTGPIADTTQPFVIDEGSLTPEEIQAIEDLPTQY